MSFFFFLSLLSNFYLSNFIFINLLPFIQSKNGAFFSLHRTVVLPHTRRRLAFCAWAFGGGLAAVLCSAQSFFYFFYFFVKILFEYPPLSILSIFTIVNST
jgi:hypothetical protein